MIGATGICKRVSRDGQVFSASAPGLISALDLAHKALAAETGGRDLLMRQAPWSNPRGHFAHIKCREREGVALPPAYSPPPTATLAGVSFGVDAREGPLPHK